MLAISRKISRRRQNSKQQLPIYISFAALENVCNERKSA